MNLSIKIITGVLIFTIILFSILGYLQIKETKEILEELQLQQANAIVKAFEANLQSRNDIYNTDMMLSLINDQMWLNPDINSISINMPQKARIAALISSKSHLINQTAIAENNVALENDVLISNIYAEGNSRVLKVITPIRISGQGVGLYEIDISLDQVDKQIQDKIRYTFFSSIIMMIIASSVLFIALKVILIKPILSMKKGVLNLGAENFNYRIKLESSDELGVLAREFNAMAGKLKRAKQITDDHEEVLEIEVKQRTAELNKKNIELINANKKILELVKAKTDFINKSAHDLGTPITPILNLLPRIKSKTKDKIVLNDLTIIERNARFLKKITDNLIIYLRSHDELSTYTFKESDIIKLIENVLETYEGLFLNKKVKIKKILSQNANYAEVDELKFTEVIQNLISNAIKFINEKGIITISARKIKNNINIKISDTGIGMSEQTISNIFKEFYQADESRKTEGIGLGLAICKKIIEMHKGRIWAESPGEGRGSAFTIEIPISQK